MIRRLSLLCLLALLGACSSLPSSDPVETQVLLRASNAWDGSPYPDYPDGRPELSLLKIRIAPNTSLDWHLHRAPNAGYLLAGDLRVETREGRETRLRAGDALAEVVDVIHRGHAGPRGAELVVFYAGSPGLPLAEREASPTAVAHALPTPATLSALLDGIDQRLAIAEAVALHKWGTGQSVQAEDREQQVVAQARSQAASHGLDEQRVGDFFNDQIEANKLLQYGALSGWHAEGRVSDNLAQRDLTRDLRPSLDRLRDQLLRQLAAFDQQKPPRCEQVLAQAIQQRDGDALRNAALTRASGRLCEET
ncbi:MAG: gamma subclass chorismate mutase AroQ [Paucimonas sp.]|jgi:chorismate mutase|nr:gamma subclass chorismate mutase AroQ [Paucimonas sp.]